MKLKQTFVQAFGVGCLLAATLGFPATAQQRPLPRQAQEHILVAAKKDTLPARKTLSGIHLLPAQDGTFQLDFSQPLTENALLEITNTAGRVVFQKPVSVAAGKSSWRYKLGKLQPDVYLIEVKTSNTTYWSRFKVGK